MEPVEPTDATRTDAAETAYDDGICQRVKLLEQIAQHKRHGEEQDHFQRAAAGKVFLS